LEGDALLGERVEVRRGRAAVAVAPDAVGAQRVDEHEEDVQVLALREGPDLLDAPLRARGQAHVELRRDGDEEQEARRDEVGPGGVEETPQHGPVHDLQWWQSLTKRRDGAERREARALAD